MAKSVVQWLVSASGTPGLVIDSPCFHYPAYKITSVFQRTHGSNGSNGSKHLTRRGRGHKSSPVVVGWGLCFPDSGMHLHNWPILLGKKLYIQKVILQGSHLIV